MIHHELLIVGGGAAGLMAAVTAKDFGIDVAILEATDRIGKKILATGNGRCNISNISIAEPFINYHSNNDNFYYETLKSFSVNDTLDFFLSLGLPIIELQSSKLYPQSLQASSVVDIFRLALEDRNIPVYTECKVKDIHRGKVFKLSTNNEALKLFTCDKLLLTCGGKTAPKTGSDGTGYYLSEKLGHNIIPQLPGIVQLKLDYPHLKSLSGVKFDGYASLLIDGKEERRYFGEILFTDYGISGPPILQLSGFASQALSKGKKAEIVVDMLPRYTVESLEDFIECHFAMLSYRPVIDALIGVINKKLIPTVLKESKIEDLHMPCYELDWKEKKSLINTLKEWKFTCVGTNDFNQAQVTIGGIDTTEVNHLTLESKLIPGLYFAGELLDVHGDCGGFNLQWAWSSGHRAAECIAKA